MNDTPRVFHPLPPFSHHGQGSSQNFVAFLHLDDTGCRDDRVEDDDDVDDGDSPIVIAEYGRETS